MKALVLAAGRGSRFGNLSQGTNKCMLEIGGRPLIEYTLQSVALLPEIEQVVIVVGYRAEDIMERLGGSYKGKKIVYVRQRDQHGLVHAIECAKDALGASDFMLMLGDEFMANARHSEFIEAFHREEVFGLCGVLRVKDRALIKKTYAVIELNDGRMARLVEKPNNPVFNDMMGTGNCIFKNKVLEYIAHTPINQNRHEKELPDLIQCAIDDGNIVKTFTICNEYINVNSPEELDRTKSYFAHL